MTKFEKELLKELQGIREELRSFKLGTYPLYQPSVPYVPAPLPYIGGSPYCGPNTVGGVCASTSDVALASGNFTSRSGTPHC